MITKAGQNIIDRYRRASAAGWLKPVVNGLGETIPGNWMRVGVGNGAELSAAQKLARDGHARMIGGAHNHWLEVTQ